jgi:putative ABC transport system permease protein
MNFIESLKVAFTALRANKLRSLLTMLGVIIGVGSVIVMISLIQGARQKVVSQFKGDGANILFAFYNPKRDRERKGTFSGLKMDDMHAIEERVGSVTGVSPSLELSGKTLYGVKNYASGIYGCTDRFLEADNSKLAYGRFIERSDNDIWAKVCVIGDNVRKELFEKEDPIGKEIVFNANGQKVSLVIIGVMERKGTDGFGGAKPDDRLYVPITTVQKRFTGSDNIGAISARSIDGVASEQAADEVFAVLKQRHGEDVQDVVVDTQEGLIKRLDSLLLIFQLVLGGIGGLSLLVGGIGIMNIMLVSVTERTREIGIRKAVGAKRADILWQFVIESITVASVGGLIGVAFGWALSKAIGMIPIGANGDKLETYVPLWAAGLGFGFAAAVGMFFGIYPAVRASKLDPIEALRYE